MYGYKVAFLCMSLTLVMMTDSVDAGRRHVRRCRANRCENVTGDVHGNGTHLCVEIGPTWNRMTSRWVTDIC